jgi:hypothetical protein
MGPPGGVGCFIAGPTKRGQMKPFEAANLSHSVLSCGGGFLVLIMSPCLVAVLAQEPGLPCSCGAVGTFGLKRRLRDSRRRAGARLLVLLPLS